MARYQYHVSTTVNRVPFPLLSGLELTLGLKHSDMIFNITSTIFLSQGTTVEAPLS